MRWFVGHEPEVDGAQARDDAAVDAGLLEDLADGGVLGRLAGLDVALRQRPHQPAPPVAPGDEGRLGLPAAPIEHESARRGLLDAAARRGAAPRGRRSACGHTGRINRRRGSVAPRLRSAGVAPELRLERDRRASGAPWRELAPLARLLTGLGRALRGGRARAGPRGRPRARRPPRPAVGVPATPTSTSRPTPARRPCWRCSTGFAETTWDVGIRFGTIGARIGGP